MNPIRDLEILAEIARERQAEMRREAWVARSLRGQSPDRRTGNTLSKWKLALALIGALLAVLLIAQLVTAAASAGGGAGHYLVM